VGRYGDLLMEERPSEVGMSASSSRVWRLDLRWQHLAPRRQAILLWGSVAGGGGGDAEGRAILLVTPNLPALSFSVCV
jgi:hypothetical protein